MSSREAHDVPPSWPASSAKEDAMGSAWLSHMVAFLTPVWKTLECCFIIVPGKLLF